MWKFVFCEILICHCSLLGAPVCFTTAGNEMRWHDVTVGPDTSAQHGKGPDSRNRPYGAQFTGDRKLAAPASAPGVESDWFSEKRNSFLLTGPTWCHVCEETDRKTLLIQKILFALGLVWEPHFFKRKSSFAREMNYFSFRKWGS